VELRGATALITGGAHRLGRAIALELAAAGAHVAFTYLSSAAEARDTLRAIESHGVRGLALRTDASDDVQVARMLAEVVAAFARLDLWVANAGVFRRTPLAAATQRDWDDMFRLNFATFLVPSRHIGPLMRRRGAGCIVALADVAALHPWADYIPYCIAKRAVVALAQALAARLAPQVRVNAIAPGPVLFPADFPPAARAREIARTRLRRAGEPADISAAVRYLATNDYVTGTVLPVDGGRLLV
jgi:pteridine reductase